MKKQLIFALSLCLAPVWVWAQGVDTAAVAKEVDSLIQVSRTLTMQQKFDKALEFNALSETVVLEKLGRETAAYGNTCFNHGRILHFKGDFSEAEKWYIDAKIIREKILGKEHLDYTQSLNNLANVNWKMGNYEKAESLHLEAKAIREKLLGKEHPTYAATLNNLANLYYDMGNYEKAEVLHLEAKTIVEKAFGSQSQEYALILNYLANLYYETSRYQKAEKYYLEASIIQEKVLGKEHPDYAVCLNNLANTYWKTGNYEKAEPLHLEAKTIQEKVLGRKHTDYSASLTGLANLYYDIGNYEKAEPLYLESKAIIENVFGKEHPDYAWSLNNLANLYYKLGDYEKVELLLDQLAILNQSLIIRALHHLSEQELNNYLHTFSETQDKTLFVTQVSPNRKSCLPQCCYDNTLFYKGILLNATSQVKRLALSDTATAKKFNLLKSYERRLAAEYPKPAAKRDSISITTLEEKVNTLEKNLARTVAGYGNAVRQVKWQEVQAALKPGQAALEFVHYHYYTPKATDSTMYAALFLRPGDAQPQFIPLFEEKELLPLLRGATGGSNFLNINALYAKKVAGNKQKSLYDLIWKPLENLLKDSKTVYCAPSGLLHRLNLAAIPNTSGKIFGDQHGFVLLGSTRQLVVPNPSTTVSNSAYLAGGIRYDADSTAIALANRGTSSRSIRGPTPLPFQPDSASATRSGTLDYLPATAAEVREIGQTLTTAGIRAKVDTGFYATEEAFRQLGVGTPCPRIIHLATHGYFFPDPVKKDQKTFGGFGQEPVFKMSEHPMIRSGLIMAGAKQAWLTGQHPSGLEDGILTAYEISQMNLSGTELVVLSACETGLGDIVGNEGVYGLQRAFKIAGAKYLVMSLWKVDDRSTRAFMTAFYRHWLTDKQPVPQAFRSAQRELRAKRPGAYDWAGFVLVE